MSEGGDEDDFSEVRSFDGGGYPGLVSDEVHLCAVATIRVEKGVHLISAVKWSRSNMKPVSNIAVCVLICMGGKLDLIKVGESRFARILHHDLADGLDIRRVRIGSRHGSRVLPLK